MENFIKQFVDAVSDQICWDLQIEEIVGFNDQQIDTYSKALNIKIQGDLRHWFAHFGKCSGGLFTSNNFHLYWYVFQPNISCLEDQAICNKERQIDLYQLKAIDKTLLESKPYFFYYEENYQYFIFTENSESLVWLFIEGNNFVECTNMNFIDFLKFKLNNLYCNEGVWIDRHTLKTISTSNVF